MLRRPLRTLPPVLVLAAAVAACDSGPPPPRPTTVQITPGQHDFDALGDSRTFSAVVFDQNGDTMRTAAVAWSSSDPAVASVDLNGLVRSVGNGTAVIRVESDDASGRADVRVEQVVADFRKDRGDAQQAQVGAELLEPIQVRVRDPRGGPIAGMMVDFSVEAGEGSVDPPSVATDADGRAAAVWTMGTTAGAPQQARATLRGSSLPTVAFSASNFAGPPAQMRELSGGGQTGLVDTGLAVPLSVAVLDAFDNPRVTSVTFTVTAGGGSVSQQTVSTGFLGVASTTWTLGPDAGEQRVVATSGDLTVEFVATAAETAGPPASIEAVFVDKPQGLAGFIIPEPISVVVRDAVGIGVEGVEVTFTATEGLTGPGTTTTNRSGVAATAWLLGNRVGEQTLEVTTPGVAPFMLAGDALDPGPVCDLEPVDPSGFDIDLCFTTPVNATIEAAFVEAKERWEAIIVGDLVDVGGLPNAGEVCLGDPAAPLMRGLVLDDLIIYASVVEIDGEFNVLGSASPCYVRNSNDLTTIGFMRFDVADLDRLAANGQLADVILHEMGHVLGIGTLWEQKSLLQSKATPDQTPPGPDTHFSGAMAIGAFDTSGGTDRSVGQKVPVENVGRGGSINGHWRESTMDRELMTPFLDAGGPNPLSIISIQSLADLGYTVSNDAADAYTVTNVDGAPGLQSERRGIWIIEEQLSVPLRVVDEATGRVIRILPPPNH
ncbi:leishmanolysin-related zinc metalloendopeptidase [Gaopeijia maritima]|uniref:leishmanolysin-related zinc metalloendopeptidase n=1 Tax=Gaopeijia maritima TaxID=3119007 RepID=UPI003252CA91